MELYVLPSLVQNAHFRLQLPCAAPASQPWCLTSGPGLSHLPPLKSGEPQSPIFGVPRWWSLGTSYLYARLPPDFGSQACVPAAHLPPLDGPLRPRRGARECTHLKNPIKLLSQYICLAADTSGYPLKGFGVTEEKATSLGAIAGMGRNFG